MFNLFRSSETAATMNLRYSVRTTSLLVALLATSVSNAAEYTAKYTINSQYVPEITLFNPEATTAITFARTEDFKPQNGSGNMLSICYGGVAWVKGYKEAGGEANQKLLASFIYPKFTGNVNADSNYIAVDIELNKPYTLYLPLTRQLKDGESDFKTEEASVTFGVRGAFPFGDNCSPTEGVQQFLENITIPVRSIADATPVIQQLVPGQQQLGTDGSTFIAKVKILGVTKDNTVLWIDDNNPNGLKMTQTEEITAQPDTDHKLTGKERVGGWYTVTLPTPTAMTYTAKVQVRKTIQDEINTFEEPMVNDYASKPYLKVSDCSDTQCQIIWNSVVPYRDVNGSLGLSLKGNLPVLDKTQLPTGIFTLQRNSEWKQTGLFAGQTDTTLARSNWKFYSSNASPFLTSSPLPQKGVFLLNFESGTAQ